MRKDENQVTNSTSTKLLIVDDEAVAVKNLNHIFTKSGYQVTARTSGVGGYEALEKHHFDVVITDLRMEKVDGMAILERALVLDPDMAVILLTGHGSYDSAVEAMKLGAYHYIAKPYRLDEIREIVKNAADYVFLKRENRQLKELVGQGIRSSEFITQDPATQRLLETLKQVAPSDCNVLISGESGTGKELAARYLHGQSHRAQAAFVAINCGALQEELLANELFGHVKGAYTGATESHKGLIEEAEGGTLFLDEITEMSTAMQVKLLRVLQENEVQRVGSVKNHKINVRFLAASNRNLRDEVASGRFRQDLYFRLNVVSVHMPTLAERKEDIPVLAYYFLKKYNLKMGKNIQDISMEAVERLCQYDYPGNIRELENIIERGVALATDTQLTHNQLPAVLNEQNIQSIRQTGDKFQTLEEREIEYIQWVIEKTGGNRTQAAEILGIDRVSLWRKLKKYDLE